MNNAEITKSNKRLVDDVLDRVATMSDEEFKSLADSMVRFYNYSTYNQILLYFSNCSQVASFKKWKELGRTIKKGGKATWILAPKILSKKVENEKGEEEKKDILTGFISVPVFDISQTEGKEIERNMATKSDIKLDDLKNSVKRLGYDISSKALEISKGGYICEKEIVLNSNLNEIENTATLIHELCHGELGHTNAENEKSRMQKEQEAELTTYIVCKFFGIERKSEFYLKSWQLTENIMQSFLLINKVATKIIKEINVSLNQ